MEYYQGRCAHKMLFLVCLDRIVILWCPLVFFSTLALGLKAVHADLLVVLLKSRHVLTSFRELSLLHPLSDVPVDEGTLGTSGRTCGPAWPTPRRWQWCC